MRRWFFALLLMTTARAAVAAETVEILDGEFKLHGVLYRPAGPGPFSAVVALHSCDGLFIHPEEVDPRYQDWGNRLSQAGLAVLFPDSFGSRGLASQCKIRERAVRSSGERVNDAVAARRWLQEQSFVVGDRVSLLGWAGGAIAALWAVRPRVARDGMSDFRSAVAFYPGCRRLDDIAWSARVPTLILIGKADDWSPAAACEHMVQGARDRSAGATIITYPGALHEFDRPDYPVRELTGLAYSANGSGKAHVGTNAAARQDAIKRVPEWLIR